MDEYMLYLLGLVFILFIIMLMIITSCKLVAIIRSERKAKAALPTHLPTESQQVPAATRREGDSEFASHQVTADDLPPSYESLMGLSTPISAEQTRAVRLARHKRVCLCILVVCTLCLVSLICLLVSQLQAINL